MKHYLVVGGTGMLSEVVCKLVNEGNKVTVIARNQSRLDQLQNQCHYPELFNGLSLDYEDFEKLQHAMRTKENNVGDIDCVVAWIHSNESEALSIIIDEMATKETFDVYHVLGSRSNLLEVKMGLDIPSNCKYHQVKLGFIVQNNSARWLTNKEISGGVLHALDNEEAVSIVGVLEPWEMRP
ncbi:SDR family NAD(P)-dependent oxidoreductase [Paenibacillus sp. L3-i20]|uniref:SDR family NAD(P)-dependent oxidoreductase n=1 Tax=Paenibacillus sp. L3-i20 TaxID=2905833 RepID=UPI001EE141D5|nr:SDR family NAD(P)-dependent oxidoreductase [Paenibacillus sp. L3-i20]GKU78410.1 short-chain dehydrogenase [Paenibacillus sp. L3-i20]